MRRLFDCSGTTKLFHGYDYFIIGQKWHQNQFYWYSNDKKWPQICLFWSFKASMAPMWPWKSYVWSFMTKLTLRSLIGRTHSIAPSSINLKTRLIKSRKFRKSLFPEKKMTKKRPDEFQTYDFARKNFINLF